MTTHDPANTPSGFLTPVLGTDGIVWPALPRPRDAGTFSLLAQFEMSQWWPPETLQRQQLRQAAVLIEHAARNVPFYRQRLVDFADRSAPSTMAEWRNVPILKRADIRQYGPSLAARTVPEGHGGTSEIMTSGSTGEPVTVRWSVAALRMHTAFILRDHLWHRRDLTGTFAVVRRLSEKLLRDGDATKTAQWAPGCSSGPMLFRDVHEPIDETLDWLTRVRARFLLTYPTFLRALLDRSEEIHYRPEGLTEVLTNGEALPADLRARCSDIWGVRLVDRYSMQEAGSIALQCPEHDHYLVQAEAMLLEVLDDDGEPCGPGETGRVVVTPLHNFPTPLIRYEIGDYAEVGEPCASGRGLPVLTRILGRSRNMLATPSGKRVWASLTGAGLEAIDAIRQFQVYQAVPERLNLRLVVSRPLSSEEEAHAREAMVKATGHAFDVHLDYVDAIPRTPGGKLEDVLSEVGAGDAGDAV